MTEPLAASNRATVAKAFSFIAVSRDALIKTLTDELERRGFISWLLAQGPLWTALLPEQEIARVVAGLLFDSRAVTTLADVLTDSAEELETVVYEVLIDDAIDPAVGIDSDDLASEIIRALIAAAKKL